MKQLRFVPVSRLLKKLPMLTALGAGLVLPGWVAAQPAITATWNNYSGTGTLWSNGPAWLGGAAPTLGIDNVLGFGSSIYQVAGGYTSTYDSAFDLNSLVLSSGAASNPSIVITGGTAASTLQFQSSSLGLLPSIWQNGTGRIVIQNGTATSAMTIMNGTTLEVRGTGTGELQLNGAITQSGGTGSLTINQTGTRSYNTGSLVRIAGNNTYSGGTTLTSGNLVVGSNFIITITNAASVTTPSATPTFISASAIQNFGTAGVTVNGGTLQFESNVYAITSGAFLSNSTTAYTQTGIYLVGNQFNLNNNLVLTGPANTGAVTLIAAVTGPPAIAAVTGSVPAFVANFQGVLTGNGGVQFRNYNGTLNYAFTGASTFTGPVDISPQGFTFVTASLGTSTAGTGTMATASGFTVTGNSTLLLDNTTAAATRLGTSQPLTLNRANFTIRGFATGNVTESLGTLTLNGTGSINILGAVNNANLQSLTVNSINRGAFGNGTLLYTGTNANSGTGTGESRLTVTNNPGGAIGGVDSGLTRPILPYVVINNAPSTVASTSPISASLVRYPSGGILAPLGTSDLGTDVYLLSQTSPISTNNVRFQSTAASPNAFSAAGLNTSSTINSLILDTNTAATNRIGVAIAGSGTLTVTSGAVLSTVSGNTTAPSLPNAINVAGLGFGSNTGYIHALTTTAVTSVVSGSNGVVKSLLGDLYLTGSNTFTGGLTVNSGYVHVGTDSSLGAAGGSITLNGGLTSGIQFNPLNTVSNQSTANLTINRPMTIGPAGGVLFSNLTNGNLNYSGNIGGVGQLTKLGNGVLTLSGDNSSLTGGVSIAAGTLAVGTDTALGAANGNLILAGGTFFPTATFSTNRDVLMTATSFVMVNSGITLTMNGNLTTQTARDTIVKDGPGDIVFTNANTMTGQYQNGTSAFAVRGSNTVASTSSGRTILSGASGTLAQAAAVLVLGNGEVVLENGTTVNNNRIGSVTVGLNAGRLTVNGNPSADVAEHIGAISFGASTSAPFGGVITLSQPGTTNSTNLYITGFSAAGTTQGTVLVRGTNLGGGGSAGPAVGAGSLIISASTATITGLTSGTGSSAIFTALVGSSSASGEPTTFLSPVSVVIGAPPLNANQANVVPFTGYSAATGSIGAGSSATVYDATGAASFTGASSALALRISAGGSVDLGAGTLTLASGQLLAAGGANGGISNGTLSFGSTVPRITVATGSDLAVGAVIAGSGSVGLVKFGGGTLTLNTAATVTGTNTAGGISIAGGTIRYGVANALPTSSLVIMNTGTTLDLNNTNSTLGFFTGAGNINIGSGSLTLSSTTTPSIASATTISGTGGIVKTNTNTLTFVGDNSGYAGTFSILNGTVAVNSNAGIGTGTILLGDTSGTNRGILQIGSTVSNFANPITVQAGSTPAIAHTIQFPASTQISTLSGNITINNTTGSYASGGFTQTNVGLRLAGSSGIATGAGTITGTISGPGALVVFSGNWNVTANNTYAGGTFFDTTTSTVFGVGNDGAFGTGPVAFSTGFGVNLRADSGTRTLANNILISSTGGYFGVMGTNPFVFNGNIDLQGATATVVQSLFIGNTATTTINGIIQNGTGGLNKNGTGTLNLTNANTYTGTTTINAGIVLVNNTTGNAIPGAVTVNSGAILGGGGATPNTGSVGGLITVNAGGIVSPGANTGILTANAGVTFSAGSIFTANIQGTASGTGHSQLRVTTGTLDLGNATLNALFSGYTPTASDVIRIIDYTGGTLLGTFNGLAEGATAYTNVLGSGINYNVYYGTAVPNMVVLSPVPEPASLLALGGAVFGVVGFVRRRRVSKGE